MLIWSVLFTAVFTGFKFTLLLTRQSTSCSSSHAITNILQQQFVSLPAINDSAVHIRLQELFSWYYRFLPYSTPSLPSIVEARVFLSFWKCFCYSYLPSETKYICVGHWGDQLSLLISHCQYNLKINLCLVTCFKKRVWRWN